MFVCLSLNLYIEPRTPSVPVFGDEASKEVISLKEVVSVETLSDTISILLRKDMEELPFSFPLFFPLSPSLSLPYTPPLPLSFSFQVRTQ